jgi:Cytochrome c554 and c-prime
MEMNPATWMGIALAVQLATLEAAGAARRPKEIEPQFQTSDRCMVCHNGLQTPSGEDISIGFNWRASMMANSARDPYWQASVRRESIDHPEAKADIEDECSVCHMPITRYESKLRGKKGEVFSHLPFEADPKNGRQAADGVSCSVCHQISKERLGTRESFNGGFVVDAPESKDQRPEFGPFEIEKGQTRIMRTSSEGYHPTKDDHIRQSELCATCHTLYTKALGPGGTVIGELPEQMPYPEWQHSSYKDQKSCQSCHMPAVEEEVPITRVLGKPREGAARHVFVASNFFMLRMLNRFRDELSVTALPQELSAAAAFTLQYLQSQGVHLSIEQAGVSGGRFEAEVFVDNLGGHKLPSAYPSRRAWLHVVIRDRDRKVIFESGALNPDGSIQGNDNDADPRRFEPHYREIRGSDQVQIYESIMAGPDGVLTTSLLTAVRYVKDNRLLPHGFDKTTATPDIAVVGEAANDPNFTDAGDRVKYSAAVTDRAGPFTIEAELLYQPIGYRWANNLKSYNAPEPRRFNAYYDAMGAATTMSMARATRIIP